MTYKNQYVQYYFIKNIACYNYYYNSYFKN